MPKRLLLIPKYRVPATPLSIATMYAAAGYGVWQGLGLLLSSPVRLGSPSLAVIRHAPMLWGLAALVFGVLVAWGVWHKHFWIKALGLFGLATWSVTFATTTLTVLIINPIAGPTAPPAYYYIAVNLAILIWADPKGADSATPNPTA